MVTTVRRIDPVSLAKIYAVITGAITTLFSIPMGCLFVIAGSALDEFGGMGAGVGISMMIMYPIMGVVMGFVLGGVEIELDGLMEPDIL